MVAAPAPRASLIGATLGPYAVEQLIGCGAVGAVYSAFDQTLRRRVALKVLLGSPARNPELVQRFRQEALAVAPLRHPNIVRIYEAGIREGTPFIAMELVEGEPLESLIERKGRLPWPHALHIGKQVGDALSCAHRNGLVHRDVKPANILIDKAGRARLTDFGLALAGSEQGTRRFAGTVEYMAPEQCRGSALTHATDLFALGATLYRLITGELPFTGASPEAVIASVLHSVPQRPRALVSDLPDDVSRLVMYLLQKDPRSRPASARAVCEQIERLQREQGGLSAMPEALDAYMREQSQIRSLPTRRVAHRMERRAHLEIRSGLPVAAAVAIIAASALAGFAAAKVTAAPHNLAPVALEATIADAGNARQVQLPLPGYRVVAIEWDGEQKIRATLVGDPTSTNAGIAKHVEIDAQTGAALGLYQSPASLSSIAPQHSRLARITRTQDDEQCLWVTDVSGAETPLIVGMFDAASVAVSPTGEQISLVVFDAAGETRAQVWQISPAQLVAEMPNALVGSASWSRLDNTLLVSQAEARQLVRLTARGERLETFAQPADSGGTAAVAADGAIAMAAADRPLVYIIEPAAARLAANTEAQHGAR